MYLNVLPPLNYNHYWVVRCSGQEDFDNALAYLTSLGCVKDIGIKNFRPVVGVNRAGMLFTDSSTGSNDLDITDLVLDPLRLYKEYICSMSEI